MPEVVTVSFSVGTVRKSFAQNPVLNLNLSTLSALPACPLPQSFLVDLLRELTAVLPLDLPGLAMTSSTSASSLVRASPVMSHTQGVGGRDTQP